MCHVEPKALGTAEKWFHERRALWERRFDLLEEALKEKRPEKKRRKPC